MACVARFTIISPEFHLIVTGISSEFTGLSPEFHRNSSEFRQNLELKQLKKGDSHNSAFTRPSRRQTNGLRNEGLRNRK